MKLQNLLFPLLSLPLYLVASQESAQQQLVRLAAAGGGVIKLDTKTYSLLTSPKRTWSVSVLLTALDTSRRCAPCRQFDPAWKAVAKAWAGVPKEHRDNHFFATLDFDNGQTVFQQLGLQSAPVVFVFPPAEGPRRLASGKVNPSTYDFSSNGFDALPLAGQLSKHTPIQIPYKDPIDVAWWISAATGLLGFALTFRLIAPIFLSRWTWAAGTIVTSLIMTGGYMFTRIRGVPYSAANGEWIAAGYQNQFGQEVHVIAFIYGLLATSFLMLIVVIPYQQSPQRQKLQIYLWIAVITIIYSLLISLFRLKNRAYPFKILL